MEAHKEIQKHDQLKYQGLKKKAIKVELKIACSLTFGEHATF